MSYLRPEMNDNLKEMSVQGLAHVGDAVFELMVRTMLCEAGALTAKRLHGGAVALVSAKAQASAVRLILSALDDEEMAVYKRGRNAHCGSPPRGSTSGEYHSATGIEALFGYLYLSGRTGRLDELFGMMIEDQA